MSMDKMRNEFEGWECDADQGPQTDPVWLMYDAETNTYPLDKIQERWKVWQASRESQSIDLPREIKTMAGSVMYADDVRATIEAAGLKVKS